MRLYWIDTPSGRLATSAAPSGREIDREAAELSLEPIDVVVSALHPTEASMIGLGDEGSVLERAGIAFRHYPLEDFASPQPGSDADGWPGEIASFLRADKSVLVHCRAGIGRCSTLAAGALVELGFDAEEAMDRISAARGRRVPETMSQRMWVHAVAQRRILPTDDR